MSSDRRPSGWAILIYACVFIAVFKWVVILTVACIVVWCLAGVLGWICWIWLTVKGRRPVRESRDAYLRREADAQDAAYRAGDPYGYEGEYPAYTMPLTRYIDYDDGLAEWK